MKQLQLVGVGASDSAKRRQIITEEGTTYYTTQMWEGNSCDMGEIIYTLKTTAILLVKLIKLVLLKG